MNDLFQVGLMNALVAALLAVPAYCLSRWGKRPALAHVFWLFILIKLVTPPLWHVPLALQNLPTIHDEPAELADIAENSKTPSAENSAASQPQRLAFENETPAVQLLPDVEASDATLASTCTEPDASKLSTPENRAALAVPWKETLIGFWLTGTALIFCLTAYRLSAFVHSLKRVRPAKGETQDLVADLSRRLGLRATPLVGIAPMRMAPLVWGWGSHARVIIPTELWDALDGEQCAMLLVHELAHLRRGDHWVRLLEIAVRAMYWWHPIVWLAAREMREAEEQCCDAWAVWALPHAAKSYARALVDTVDFLSRSSVPLPVGASGIGQVQDLRRRLIMIMRGSTPRQLSTTTLVALLVLGGIVALMGPSFGQQQPALASVAADEPATISTSVLREVSFTDPLADDEITRLRQQEENLRRAMEALTRSLEQTKRQLDSIDGPPNPDPRIPPSQSLPRRPSQSVTTPEPQLRPRVSAPRSSLDALPRNRIGSEIQLEERMSRLEERLGQIADDLQALRQDMRPGNRPGRGLGVPVGPDVAPPTTQPPMPRRTPRPPTAPLPSVPSAGPLPPGDTFGPVRAVPPRPAAAVPSADALEAPWRENRNVDSDDALRSPVHPRRVTPPAAPATPARPAAVAPPTKPVDEKPENPSALRP